MSCIAGRNFTVFGEKNHRKINIKFPDDHNMAKARE
jgi:hypothetical protein